MKGWEKVGRKYRSEAESIMSTTLNWCLGRESNPHGRKAQGILSPLCLPVPPPRHIPPEASSTGNPGDSRKNEGTDGRSFNDYRVLAMREPSGLLRTASGQNRGESHFRQHSATQLSAIRSAAFFTPIGAAQRPSTPFHPVSDHPVPPSGADAAALPAGIHLARWIV
jgi:hypothetical protein